MSPPGSRDDRTGLQESGTEQRRGLGHLPKRLVMALYVTAAVAVALLGMLVIGLLVSR